MFCLQCGKEISDNSTVCQFCGAVQPQAQQAPVQAPEQVPQQAYQPQPQQTPYQAPYGAPQQAPYQGQFNAPPAPPAPQKKKSKTPLIIGIVVALFVLSGIGIAAEKLINASDVLEDDYAIEEDFDANGDFDFEEIPDDAVSAREFHTLEKQEANGVVRFTYYCDGDEIQGWLQEIEVDVSTYTQEEIDQLEADCNAEYQSLYGSYDCIEHSVDIFGDTFVQTYTITDVNDNIEELKAAGLVDGGLVTLYMSYEKTKTNWIAQGYTEVE